MLVYDSATAHEHQELLSMIDCIIGGKEFSIDDGIARIKKFLITRAIERHGGDVAVAKQFLGLSVSTLQALTAKPAKRVRAAPHRKKKRPGLAIKN